MGEMKSAREIAMEKIDQLGEATDEERLGWKYVPLGERLAAGYLKQDCNLSDELSQYDEKAVGYVKQGISEVLISNISLPRNDPVRRNNKRVMEGLKIIKDNKVEAENVFSGIRNIFNHYVGQGEQQRKQAYERLKAEFGARIQQAVQQQLGSSVAGTQIDVERQPQFQAEWQKLQNQLDMQYLKLLEEHKRELAAIK